MPSDASVAQATADVTVVVPLYNGAEHIAETLTSIHRQTRRPRRVVVVDDGSSDDGAAIAEAHPIGARIVRQQNLGVAVARNHGLSLADTAWIAFLDQDDLWHPTHLERTLAWLEANPDRRIAFTREIAFTVADDHAELQQMDELAGGWASILAPRTGSLEHVVGVADTEGTGEVVEHDLAALLRGSISMTTSFVADPQLLRLAGGFAPHALAMDDYWMLVNVARFGPIPQVDQPTVFYRVHSRATSRTTALGLPFLSSAVALRLGGGVMPAAEGLRGGSAGNLHRHLLTELLRSPQYRDRAFRRAVDGLAVILWPPDGLRSQRRRALVAARMPWLRTMRRSLRRR